MRRVVFISILGFLILCLMGFSTMSIVKGTLTNTSEATNDQTTDNLHTQQSLQTGATSKQ